MTEEHKHVEEPHKHTEHKEEIRIGLPKLGNKSLENISFYIIVISAIMVSVGIGIGSFIPGTILIASFGAFFVMVGIVMYMISQFLEGENG